MDISSLKKLLGLEVDLSQFQPVFDNRPQNAIILGQMTVEESFLFVAVLFCFQEASKYYRQIVKYNNLQDGIVDERDAYEEDDEVNDEAYVDDNQLDELNNKYNFWFEKNQICNLLLSHSVRSRLPIAYSNSFFTLPGFLLAIDLDEEKQFINVDQDEGTILYLN